jgi:hypothetical protein
MQLLDIRMGPGSLLLPREVRRIDMDFPNAIYGGNRGAKYVYLLFELIE